MNQLDAITVEIMGNSLRSITDEMFVALMKSAYSTNIKERRDHSTAIIDPNGRLVVQAAQALPIHIASMSGLMKSLLAKYGADIEEGDLFVANDPHEAGGTHLPDINYALPVFVNGQIIAFICNIAHHADIGGMAPGSMAGGMSEIYQEGLRIPVVRLFRRGELIQDLLDLLLLNVRLPNERRGDHFAQIAACHLGERRLKEVVQQYGDSKLREGFEAIITRTKNRMHDAIQRIPDGQYVFEDLMDGDGVSMRDIPIRLTMNVEGSKVTFDFTKSADQVPGNINVTFNATQASVCYSLKAVLDPEIPSNQGLIDVAEIRTRSGSLLDGAFPAPVAARAHTCQRIIDVCIGALSKALPNDVVAAANGANTTAVFSGTDPRTGKPYLYLETLGGGMGARPTKDGKDGVQVHITNTSNLPVESIEMEYPLRVEEYSLVPDSGGAGKFRGGLGLRRVIGPVDHDCIFNGVGERFTHRPWGLFEGQPGACGQFLVRNTDGKTDRLPDKPGAIHVSAGQTIIVETPGAGGYGSPNERSDAAIDEDNRSQKYSNEFVKKTYQ